MSHPPQNATFAAVRESSVPFRTLAAARAAGLKTAFIPRPTEHGPGQGTDLAPAQDWEVVAADFDDLAAQMGS